MESQKELEPTKDIESKGELQTIKLPPVLE